MLLSIILLAGIILGEDDVLRDEFWYRPENLPDKESLYVEQFIADSLDTSATVLRCYIHLLERTIITKKYLVTFRTNQTKHIQNFRPFGVLEFSDKINRDDETFWSSMIRIEVHSSFWIEMMFNKFNIGLPHIDGCGHTFLCIECIGHKFKFCGNRRPWSQVRIYSTLHLKHYLGESIQINGKSYYSVHACSTNVSQGSISIEEVTMTRSGLDQVQLGPRYEHVLNSFFFTHFDTSG